MKKLFLITLILFNVLSFQAKAVLTQEEKEELTDRFLENAPEHSKKILRKKILSNRINFADLDKYSSVFIINNLEEFCNSFQWIEKLILVVLNIPSLPESITKLKELKTLELKHTHTQKLPNNIGQLNNLIELMLVDNNLTSLPESIGQLSSLKELTIYDNKNLCAIPESIGQISSLTHLDLSQNPNLRSLPESIGQLSSLKVLSLSYNPNLRFLPESLRNLARSLVLLDLRHANIQEFGEGETLGKHELRTIFGNRVVFTDEERFGKRNPNILTEISIHDTLTQHQEKTLHFNIDCLKNCILADLPITNLTGDSMLEQWKSIWSNLNFSDDTQPGYLDFYTLSQYAPDAKDPSSNKECMNQILSPILTGFLKTLWGMTLEGNERSGWQMDDDQHPDLQNAIAYIFNTMINHEDPETLSMQMIQFVTAILHCPTGQKTGIDTVILAMREANLGNSTLADINAEEFESKLKQFVAIAKENIFKLAIIPGDYSQNTHVLNYYHVGLKDILGLKSLAAVTLGEKFEELGRNQFNGCLGNALNAFLHKFAPNYLIKKFTDSFETDAMKIVDKTYALKPSSLTKEERKELITAKIAHPFKLSALLNYMLKEKLLIINEDEILENWAEYFTKDPMHDYVNAQLTEMGAQKILTHFGLLIEREDNIISPL
ncbi:MAG: hypothetical protein Q8L85_00780 [Alphaproteobacteria bacterium]|nr:hypothetical protein [Alphaproteobacteria bacterium]